MRIAGKTFTRRLGRYEAVAFSTGFVLMAYELVASRILAPTIGTSIYVWTSVIGVMIAALALGYAVGGWLADQRNKPHDVVWLLLIAALCVLVTGVFYVGTLESVTMITHDPRLQGVIAATLLFAPASFIMGTISPYLAKLRISSLHTTGRSVALLSACNSLGGISGTFSAGFVFFSYMGSRQTLFMVAMLLVVSSWLVDTPKTGLRARTLATLGLLVLASLQLVSSLPRTILADIDTPTSHYQIAQLKDHGRPVNVLITGPGGFQSGTYAQGQKDLVFGYTRKLAQVVAAAPHKATIAILGGGAFTLPEYLGRQYPDSHIDVIEIDPKLPQIARQYFRYQQPSNVSVIAQDARAYLRNSTKQYDIVLVDVYNDASVPFSLATKEYAADLKHMLTNDGIVAANIIAGANPTCSPLLRSIQASYTTAFRLGRYYPMETLDMSAKQNLIGVYSNASLGWADAVPGQTTATIASGAVLTDNFAPTERLIQSCK
jgi:predicted membrane-bound spermidine synthase